ncbi:MAG: class A beta-lactamase [Bacteroidetes bacterium]|nr:class A beta-lactamase [Bacteroidota bacterium]
MKKHLSWTPLLCLLCLFARVSLATGNEDLRQAISKIAADLHGTLGVATELIETGDTLTLNGSYHSPMQSTYKFPLALHILHAVDEGRLSLDSVLKLGPKDLDNETWSPIVDEHPKRRVSLTVRDLLRYMVSGSDNNACDILFKIGGGVSACNKYIHSLGVNEIRIARTERQMHADWNAQFKNWCEPRAMLALLKLLYHGSVLSKASNDLLLKFMTKSSNSPKRLKGLLPADAVVAHKTGSSDYSKQHKISAATNDIGIITLPNGKHIAIVVFVSMAEGDYDTLETIIARVGKAAWDHYSQQ